MPPAVREVHFKGRAKDNGKRKLSDDNVIVARALAGTVPLKELAERYGVTPKTMTAAIKGLTFRHLNYAHPPQW